MVRHEDKGLLSRLTSDVYCCSQSAFRRVPRGHANNSGGDGDDDDDVGGGSEEEGLVAAPRSTPRLSANEESTSSAISSPDHKPAPS